MRKKVSIKNAVVADKLSWLVMNTFQKMAQAKMDFIAFVNAVEIPRAKSRNCGEAWFINL